MKPTTATKTSWQEFVIPRLIKACGYSAIVSFDQTGGDRRVEVFLSTDKITPTR